MAERPITLSLTAEEAELMIADLTMCREEGLIRAQRTYRTLPQHVSQRADLRAGLIERILDAYPDKRS